MDKLNTSRQGRLQSLQVRKNIERMYVLDTNQTRIERFQGKRDACP